MKPVMAGNPYLPTERRMPNEQVEQRQHGARGFQKVSLKKEAKESANRESTASRRNSPRPKLSRIVRIRRESGPVNGQRCWQERSGGEQRRRDVARLRIVRGRRAFSVWLHYISALPTRSGQATCVEANLAVGVAGGRFMARSFAVWIVHVAQVRVERSITEFRRGVDRPGI